MEEHYRIDKQFGFHYPWLWKKKQKGIFRVIKFLFREPYLVCLLTLHIFILRSPYWTTVIDIYLIGVLIFVELLNFLLARARLGFIDNFRIDFKKDPIVEKGITSYSWSKTEIISRFVFGIIVYIGSSVIGFAGMYFGTLICNPFCLSNINYTWAQFEVFYFSLITAATVGYGDISPCCGNSKIVAGMESVFVIAVVVILLFSLSNTFSIDERSID